MIAHMHYFDATLAHGISNVGAWLLTLVAALPDTIVTKQAAIQASWFERLSSVLHTLMTLSILTLTVAVVPAAWNFRRSYQKINDLLDRVYADVNPITHHASRIAENIDYVTTALRADVQRASATLTDANARLQEAIRQAESRARDFDALLAVVQDETEGAFVSTASAMHGVRSGVEVLRDTLQLSLRDVSRAVTTPAASGRAPVPVATVAVDAEGGLDEVAHDLAAVNVHRTPARGTHAVEGIERSDPVGPATYGAYDDIIDDEVEEPTLEEMDDLEDIDEDPSDLYEEELHDGEWSEHEAPRSERPGRPERPRVRPKRRDREV